MVHMIYFLPEPDEGGGGVSGANEFVNEINNLFPVS